MKMEIAKKVEQPPKAVVPSCSSEKKRLKSIYKNRRANKTRASSFLTIILQQQASTNTLNSLKIDSKMAKIQVRAALSAMTGRTGPIGTFFILTVR